MWLYLFTLNPTLLHYHQSNVQSINKQMLLKKRKIYSFYFNDAGHGNKYIRHMKWVSAAYFSNLLQALHYITLHYTILQEDTSVLYRYI